MAPVAKPTTSASKKPASHPTFLSMIQECIKANPSEARVGVSRPTLKKFLADKYKIDMSSASNASNLAGAIKRGADKGDLLLPKGISGRVKLPAKASKPAAGKENAPPKAAKKATTTKIGSKKTAAPKKTIGTKPAAAKPAAKTATKTAAAPGAKKAAPAKKPAAKKTAAPKKAPAAKAAAAKAVAKKTAAPKKKVAAAAKK